MPFDTVRIDRWLWAARFFKTRSLASTAVQGGHVQVNGVTCKASRKIHGEDVIILQRESYTWRVTVTGLAEKRGSATQAATLYQEDPASIQRRERQQEEHRAQYANQPAATRPDKKQRRQIIRFTKKEREG
ncbi:MAG: S4 domain-containing protein [Mariprofundaceae bacterium]|nr:S4 domain-containing protein [Mariprofundaceae bacterium]